MRIGAVIGVKNERELIDRCIDHLLSISVDEILVEDCGSTDGTRELVAARADSKLSLRIFDEALDLDQAAWGLHELELAREMRADWVLFLDADEFWLPRTGSMRDALRARAAEVLVVDRYNVALDARGPMLPAQLRPEGLSSVVLHTHRDPEYREKLSAPVPMPWIRGVPMPKVAIRPACVTRLLAGHHGALGQGGAPAAVEHATDVLVAHLPFTTRERFAAKVRGIRQTLSLQTSYHVGDTAWHWRRWLALADAGRLDEEFAQQVTGPEALAELLAAGRLQTASAVLNPERTLG